MSDRILTTAELTRAKNLRRAVAEYGGNNKLARKLGMTKGAYLSQLLMKKPTRTISEKTARKWERQLGKPDGWFDHGLLRPPLNSALLEQVIRAVEESLEALHLDLTPSKRAEIITMFYEDGPATGEIESTRIRKVVRLLKP